MRGEMKLTYKTYLLNDETSDTNDNVKTKINTKHMKPGNDVTHLVNSWMCAYLLVFLVLVLFLLSHSFLAHVAWLKMSECLSHLIHAWSERFLWLPWSLHHHHLPSLIPLYPQAVPASRQLLRVKWSDPLSYFAKEMGSTDESLSNTGRPSRSSWAKSVRSSFGRTGMQKATWENPFEVRLGKRFQLGMLIRTPWKRVILICVWRWHQIGWNEQNIDPDVESTQ